MKNKTKLFYIGFVSDILCLVAIVYGSISKGFPGDSFSKWIVLAGIVGIVLHLINIVLDYHWLPILPAICYGLAFGLVVLNGGPTISDKYWGVYYSGGDFGAVLTYMILIGIAMLLSLVLLFFKQTKESFN